MKVTCTIPFASDLINGVPFASNGEGAMVAVGVSKEDADNFALIPGYVVEDEVVKTEAVKETTHKGKTPKAESVV